VEILGFNPNKARPGDIALNIVHSRFFMRGVVWLKGGMMDSIGPSSLQEKCGPTSTPSGPTHVEYLTIIQEKQYSMPRVGDLWILVETNILDEGARFCTLELEEFFAIVIASCG
jgi:hypothetical protein